MESILGAVSRLYAAASGEAAWSSAVEAIANLVGGDHAALSVPDSDLPYTVTAGLTGSDLTRMSSPEAARLATPYFRALPNGAVTNRAAVESDREFERSAVYNEILRPAHGFHAITALRRSPVSAFILSVCRSRRARPFVEAEAARLQALVPHLAAAIALRHRLQAAELRLESLTGALDRLATGVILVDARGSPVFANARALAIAGDADGLTFDASGLAAATPGETRRLCDAVAELSTDRAILGRRLHLRRPSMRSALSLSLVPVWRLGVAVPGVRQARVAIFVSEPDAPIEIDGSAMADAFRLTARESEVAVLLAGGLSAAEIAVALDLRITGVRQYLKRIFEKTGARSQAALVALARGYSTPAN